MSVGLSCLVKLIQCLVNLEQLPLFMSVGLSCLVKPIQILVIYRAASYFYGCRSNQFGEADPVSSYI